MIAIIDYGAGNLFSLASSLKHIGQEIEITDDPEKIKCLVSAFLIKALEKCESGTKVVIPVESPELGELLDKVCPVSVGEYLVEGILSA